MINLYPAYLNIDRNDLLLPSYLSFDESESSIRDIIADLVIAFVSESEVTGTVYGDASLRDNPNSLYSYSTTVNNSKKKYRWQQEIEEESDFASHKIQKIRTFSILTSELFSENHAVNENINVISIFSRTNKVNTPSITMQKNDDEEVLTILLAAVGY
jgi:hypothetical protein